MKNIFSSVILLIICFFNFDSNAENLDTVKKYVIKDKVIAQDLNEKILRNGFIALDSHILYNIISSLKNTYSLRSYLDYGKVLNWPNYFSKGRMEQKWGISAFFSSKEYWYFSLNSFSEFNFLKNDGTNTYIPGIALSTTISYDQKLITPFVIINYLPSLENNFDIGIGLGFFIKVFISKNWALIPNINLNFLYNIKMQERQKLDPSKKSDKILGNITVTRNNVDIPANKYFTSYLGVAFTLSLRKYF